MSENNIKRNKILQSQKLFVKFLNIDLINELIYLFEGNGNEKITKYIEDERRKRGLSDDNINIESIFYGVEVDNPTLNLTIFKNNKKYLHLSIHLRVKDLKTKNSGVIHIRKNIYNAKTKKRQKKLLYALISVVEPADKSKSLIFSIENGYNTKGITNVHLYDKEIQEEMDVIITVLNRLFDENDKLYYIGKNKDFVNIHNKTNNTVETLNKFINHTTRKNKGKTYFAKINNNIKYQVEYGNESYYKRKTLRKSSSSSKNRKSKIETRPASTYIKNNINLSLLKPNNNIDIE